MSKATPTPAPTAAHEMRRSIGGTYVATYSPDCRTLVMPFMPSSSSCGGVSVDSTRYTAQRGFPRCRLFSSSVWRGETTNKHCSSAQALPGIEGLGLSKEETRIVLANTLRTQCTLMYEQILCHPQHTPCISSEDAALQMQPLSRSRSFSQNEAHRRIVLSI
jgi:hypothetical protein